MNAFEELEHSRVVNELIEIQDKLKNSFFIEYDVIKWNYEKAKKDGREGESMVWRELMIASCKDHEYEDSFDDLGNYQGCICVHCTANIDVGESEKATLATKKNCETCIFRGGASLNELYCNHPTIDTLEEVQIDEWMNKYFEDSKNCVHWKGKV